MAKAKKVFYAIYGPQFQGVVTSNSEYSEKVYGQKHTIGKKFNNQQLALQWVESKKTQNPLPNDVKPNVFYAIYRPDQQLIVNSLTQYNLETKGHAFAQGKKFETKAEAEQWLKEKTKKKANLAPIIDKLPVIKASPDQQAVIYIDGSFKDGLGKYAFVVFSAKSTVKLYQDFGFVYDKGFNTLMNVGAEMMACLRALEWAFSNHMKDVHLIYDYEGIISHTSNHTQNEAIITYQKMMQAFNQHMHIHFLHVRHANKELHTLAHKLTQLNV